MADKELPDLFGETPEDESRVRPLLTTFMDDGTQSIQLDSLITNDELGAETFDFHGERLRPFVKLLNALPICALLIDPSLNIMFTNECCGGVRVRPNREEGVPFLSLIPGGSDRATAQSLLEKIFRQSHPLSWEAQLDMDGRPIWARMHIRSLRMGQQRMALVLIEDLSLERKHLILIKRSEQELRKAADDLERRVLERTTELNVRNEQLRKEVAERKRAEGALQQANEELEGRVEERTAELVQTNQHLRQEIEQRRLAEEEVQESKESLEAFFNATTDVALLVNTHGILLASNKSFAERFHATGQPLSGRRLMEFMPREALSQLTPQFKEVIQTGTAVRFESRLDDTVSDNSFYPVLGVDGKISGVAVFSRDITERKRAEERLSLAAKIIESSNEAVLVTDIQGNIVDVNEAFCAMTGYSRDEVIGKNPRIMKSDRHDPGFYYHMWLTLKETGHWRGEVWDRRKSGEAFPKLLSISSVRTNEGEVTHYVGIFSDITKIKQTEERLHHLAHFDPLTQLPNRLLFRDRLQQALVETARTRRMVALMLLDLDGFKTINDSLGHKAGDDLLTAVAERLINTVRKSDTVARLGGDEFTIVLPDVTDGQAAAIVGRKIIKVLADPFMVNGKEVFVTGSMGITLYPADGAKVDRLLQNADMALYRAKEQGKNEFQFFSEEMNREVSERLDLELALRSALDRQEFVLYYQPRLIFSSNEISGAEALIRWNHPTRGLVPPVKFIGLAEDTGLIVSIGEWVLRGACRQEKLWQEMGFPPRRMAVNVSARQLGQPGLVKTVEQILSETGLNPNCLELELTESVVMKDADATIRVFNELKRTGVHLCIDDFGTGYSSLSYLKRFPIDNVKIDKSFVEYSATNADDGIIVETIIAMAHSLKLKVIAEGVETREQLQFLRQLNCDEWQGYYCSEPRPPAEIAELFRKSPTFGG